MLARQKCCCHQTARLGIPVEVAACLCCLGTPVSLQTLSAVLCQPCQGCLMWPVPCAVGCARLGPPASSGNVFLLKAHLSPFGWAGTCSAASWGPSVPCLCHHCSSMPPACLAPCHQLLPHGEAPDPQPLIHCPTPTVSSETLDFQRQLCHKNIFTVGCWGAICPQEHFGGISCSQQSQRRSRKCQGRTTWHNTRHPGGVDCAALSFEAQSWLPSSCTWLGGAFPPGSGRAADGGRAVSPAAEPTSLPLAVTVLLVARPHCPPHCPPPALPPAAAAPAGPSHSWAIFRVALSAQLSPLPAAAPLVPLLCARPGGNPSPGSSGKVGSVASTAWGSTRGVRGGQSCCWDRGL